jgi:hypothetical protein
MLAEQLSDYGRGRCSFCLVQYTITCVISDDLLKPAFSLFGRRRRS